MADFPRSPGAPDPLACGTELVLDQTAQGSGILALSELLPPPGRPCGSTNESEHVVGSVVFLLNTEKSDLSLVH